MKGAVTLHGITVLPNGSLIVPAVTPRLHGPIAPGSGNAGLSTLQPPVFVCPRPDCGP